MTTPNIVEDRNIDKLVYPHGMERYCIPTVEPFHLERDIHYVARNRGEHRVTLPTPRLVEQVCTDLCSNAIAVLDGFDFKQATSSERKAFQFILFRKVCEKLANEDLADRQSSYSFRHFSTKDGFLPPDAKAVLESGKRWTVKDLHFDPNAVIFAHGYGPMENVEGGDLLVVRINDFCRDTGRQREEVLDTFEVDNQYYPSPKEAFKDALLERYSSRVITTRGDPIIFLNNRIHDGVAHGATPIVIVDPKQPFERAYFRTSVKKQS